MLDPYDAILAAGRLAATAAATGDGAAGTVAAAAHFGGGPPGAISALPPASPVTWLYLALLAVGALLLGTVVVLGWRISSQQLPEPE